MTFKLKQPTAHINAASHPLRLSRLWIHQNAWFSVGEFDAGVTKTYTLNDSSNGAYVFVISGSIVIDGNVLQPRDEMGITETNKFTMDVIANAQVLVMEVPIG